MSASSKLRWLRKEGSEWQWAYDYMARNADEGIGIRICYAQKNRQPNHDVLTEIINYLMQTEDGREFVKKLRNSLRRRRQRYSDKDRKVCTFTLPAKTKEQLSCSAEKLKISESSIVVAALGQAEKLIEEYRKREQKIENAREIERNEAKQRIDLLRAKHHEAMRQIQKLATHLSIWELALEAEHPGIVVDQALLDSAAKAKTKAISKAIKLATAQWASLLPRT